MNEINNLLVFDTATTACTVALKTKQGVFSRHQEQANIHSKALLLMIDEVIGEAAIRLSDIDLLGVGVGPGSFTGLRIGIGVAQGLAYSNFIPVAAISSLEMIAINVLDDNILANVKKHTSILVGHDARMSEMYLAEFHYQQGYKLSMVDEPVLLKPPLFDLSERLDHSSSIIVCGNAWDEYFSQFNENEKTYLLKRLASNAKIFPNAEKVVDYISQYKNQLKLIDWSELVPLYVRNDVAKKSSKNSSKK